MFFRKDRFTLLDSGTFWLSETPEVVGSLGWDGACERIATWVVLRDRDGRELFFIDTHLDHVGQVARDEGVSLLMKRIETLSGGRPVILTGDFNSEPGSSVVAHVQKDGVLRDAKAIAAQRSGTDWSFSDFGQIPEATERTVITPKKHNFTSIIYSAKNDTYYRENPYNNIDVVDRIGSGDAYVSGALYGYLKHGDCQKALEYGNAMAAIKHSVIGDMVFTDLEEIDSIIKQHKNTSGYQSEMNR